VNQSINSPGVGRSKRSASTLFKKITNIVHRLHRGDIVLPKSTSILPPAAKNLVFLNLCNLRNLWFHFFWLRLAAMGYLWQKNQNKNCCAPCHGLDFFWFMG
jgi:hypothetical protein